MNARAPKSQVIRQSQTEADEFVAQLRKVEKDNPKTEDVKQLRAMLKRNEVFWHIAGDLMQQAQHNAIAAVNWGKSKTLVRESVEEGMHRIRDELGYAKAPMLEKLLIEQVVTTWLRHSIAEVRYSHNMNGSMSLAQADYWDRALSASQRRYLRAIESLARVRRLKLPMLQVNVAQSGAKQMNLATNSKPPKDIIEGT